MKNFLAIAGICGLTVALSACSTWDAMMGDSSAPTPVANGSTQHMTAEAAKAANMPSSKVTLAQKGNRLIAKITTNWNNQPQGSIDLHWRAPQGSQCISTHLPIKKYRENNDKTWAARSINPIHVASNAQPCTGKWTVEATTKTGTILSTATYTVKTAEKPEAPAAHKS